MCDSSVRVTGQVVFSQLGFPGGCKKAGGARGLMLDIGANFGYYTAYAAAMGCRSAPTT